MSKAVLISIRPKWCEKIISGEKTIEVRKTKPKLIPPFKCYIYCTAEMAGYDTLWVLDAPSREKYSITAVAAYLERPEGASEGNRKVIGEFTCNRVTNIFSNSRFWLDEDDVLHTCLSAAEMRKYANGAHGLYGWHISDLRVYDHPRDLWEFTGLRETKFGAEPVPITRPPQSWRYVEEELWND